LLGSRWNCTATGVSVDAEGQGDGGETSEEMSHVEDSNIAMWLQILDEEAAQLIAEEEDYGPVNTNHLNHSFSYWLFLSSY
jgi:hypothetical protein